MPDLYFHLHQTKFFNSNCFLLLFLFFLFLCSMSLYSSHCLFLSYCLYCCKRPPIDQDLLQFTINIISNSDFHKYLSDVYFITSSNLCYNFIWSILLRFLEVFLLDSARSSTRYQLGPVNTTGPPALCRSRSTQQHQKRDIFQLFQANHWKMQVM